VSYLISIGDPLRLNEAFTLPELQAEMGFLEPGGNLNLAQTDYERLFGVRVVGLARFLNFAEGRKCIVIHPIPSGGVVLRKKPTSRALLANGLRKSV
jgi:hypothetical protein